MVHTFIYDGDYFALDVETGSVHVLDKPAYEAVTALDKVDDPDSVLAATDDPLLLEIKSLKDSGLLFSLPEKDEARSVNAPGNGGVIKADVPAIWRTTATLDAGYCFAEGGAFAGRRELMSEAVAHAGDRLSGARVGDAAQSRDRLFRRRASDELRRAEEHGGVCAQP